VNLGNSVWKTKEVLSLGVTKVKFTGKNMVMSPINVEIFYRVTQGLIILYVG
jgi:hypothetical protein